MRLENTRGVTVATTRRTDRLEAAKPRVGGGLGRWTREAVSLALKTAASPSSRLKKAGARSHLQKRHLIDPETL